MRSGRSSSDGIPARALTVLFGGLLLVPCAVASPVSPPPAPAATDPAPSADPAPARCPRCGYRPDPGWRFCPACGWDLRTLTGRAAAARLTEIGHRTMGLVVVKEGPKTRDIVPPKVYQRIKRFPFASIEPRRRKAFATAFPFGRAGMYVTAARVLEHGVEAQLRSYNNRIVPARIVAHDVASGVGLLEAAGGPEPLAAPAETPSLDDPSWVVCYPTVADDDLVRFLPQSLHRGRLTSTGVAGTFLVSFENLLRTDHTIPDGCVGAPLVDQRGATAGMIIGASDSGITYALPTSGLERLVEALAGQVPDARPYFGLGLVAPDARRRARFGIDPAEGRPVVPYVVGGSPAAMAGVTPGDLLVSVAGQEIATVPAAGALLLGASPGVTARLGILRGGARIDLEVTPGRRPAQILLDPADEIQDALELNLAEVVTGPASQMGLRATHLVRGGRGEGQGFKEGDVIQAVNGKGVRRCETFNILVRRANPQVFDDADGGVASGFPYYSLDLEVRTADGLKETRDYVNLFPIVLAPPVY